MIMNNVLNNHVNYNHVSFSEDEMLSKSQEFYEWLYKRRSIRHFSDSPVPIDIIKNVIRAASTAPSGANKQPYTFCVVANPDMKRKIRLAAEREEFENYNGRMPNDWVDALAPLETNWKKDYLETAPYLIVVFKKVYDKNEDGKSNNYYVNESVGLAVGMLLAAIHNAGLVSLTHTPSPMNFLKNLLDRPENERPYMLLPIGYPSEECNVPNIARKTLGEIMVEY